MWYICYDKETGEVRRVIELSSQAKADAIQKYRMSEALKDKPDVNVIPEPSQEVLPIKTEKEKVLEILGLTQTDIDNIKKIKSIETEIASLK
jgi:hypothetical protein